MNNKDIQKNVDKIIQLLESDNYHAGVEIILTLNNKSINEGTFDALVSRISQLIEENGKEGFELAEKFNKTKIFDAIMRLDFPTTELPEGLEKFKKLEMLSYGYGDNPPSSVPKNIIQLHIEEISFQENMSDIYYCNKLQKLDVVTMDCLSTLDGLPLGLTELRVDNVYKLRNVSAICDLENLKSLLITNCPKIVPLPKYDDMNTLKKVKEYQQLIKSFYKDGELNIKFLVDKIDPDLLTSVLENFGDAHNEFSNRQVLLLNIELKDLVDQNLDKIYQVGYMREYGDRSELEGLIWWYFKKCREWYGYNGYEGNLQITDKDAKQEAKVIWEEEEQYNADFLILLYCEAQYVWAYGGCNE